MALVNDRSVLMFSGDFVVPAIGVLTAWLENSGRFGYLGSLIKYPLPKGQARVLRVKPVSNTMATDTVFTVMKAGVATALFVTVPAGSIAIAKLALPAPGIEWPEDDGIDLQFSNTNGNGTMYVAATVEIATYDEP